MEENLNGTSLVHEYDEHGRRIGSSGSKTARKYQWAKHQLQQLSVGEHTPLQFAYHPSGHEKTRATEQGFSLHHQWSETGLLLQQQLGRNGDSLRQYQYDALDRLVGIDDAKRGQSRFSLNANGQVQAVRQQKTWESQQRFVHLFGYDSELNLNQQGFATEYGDSNVVSLDDARVKRQSRKYKDGFRPKTTRFVWNGDDRLTHIELPDGGWYRYRYDPLGRRVAKECLSTQRITEYLWDGANIVQHSQKTAGGSVVQTIEYLYEPESFRPLAQVTHKANQASQLHYIVTDHAGTPQELCSENGDVVWQGEQALWGHYQQQNTLPNHGFRENAQNDELYCDLRYQGQIEDRESGLYYNVNRYYDADSGQYLSPDPIGFAGGLRPQAYVFNPLELVDPLGLMPWPNPTKQGHHLIYKNKAKSMGWEHLASSSTTPTFFFNEPYIAGSHEAIHRAQRPYVGKVQGPWTGSPEELISASKAGLGELDWIKGNLKIPATGEILAENVTPLEAFDKLEEWHHQQLRTKKGC